LRSSGIDARATSLDACSACHGVMLLCWSAAVPAEAPSIYSYVPRDAPLIPVLIDDTPLPAPLSHKHYSDLRRYGGFIHCDELAALALATLAYGDSNSAAPAPAIAPAAPSGGKESPLRPHALTAVSTMAAAIGTSLALMWQAYFWASDEGADLRFLSTIGFVGLFIVGFAAAILVRPQVFGAIAWALTAAALTTAASLVATTTTALEQSIEERFVATFLMLSSSGLLAWLMRRTWLGTQQRFAFGSLARTLKDDDTAAIDVFISYKSSDRQAVSALADALTLRGLRVWWDTSLVAGQSFGTVIARMLERARAVVLCHSNAALGSAWVAAEAGYAAARDNLIVAAIDNDAGSLALAHRASIDFARAHRGDHERLANELAAAVAATAPRQEADIGQWFHTQDYAPLVDGSLVAARPARAQPPAICRRNALQALFAIGGVTLPLAAFAALADRSYVAELRYTSFGLLAAPPLVLSFLILRKTLPALLATLPAWGLYVLCALNAATLRLLVSSFEALWLLMWAIWGLAPLLLAYGAALAVRSFMIPNVKARRRST
jgi:hypothetical protein